MRIEQALQRLFDGDNLSQEETGAVFRQVMSGEATSAQIGGLLAALRVKGETPGEVAGAAQTMREFATRVVVEAPNLIDTCGTGGSGVKLFNISTAAAFAAAAAGAHVAKHGNRKMTSFSGSADVLEAAGANINITHPPRLRTASTKLAWVLCLPRRITAPSNTRPRCAASSARRR